MSDDYRVNIRIPQELWAALKKAAALEGKTLTALVEDWSLTYVEVVEKKHKITLLKRRGA